MRKNGKYEILYTEQLHVTPSWHEFTVTQMAQLIFTFYLGFQSHTTWEESVLIYNQATKF